MRQNESITGRLGRRLIVLTLFASLLTLFFLYPRGSSSGVAVAQQGRRRQAQRRRPATPAATTAARKYSRFKHVDHRLPVAKLECASCHTIPSAAPFEAIDPSAHLKDVAAATKPSVKGYPYHDSCVRCHRSEFFKGAAPPICTVCHTRSNPRLTAREIHPFPKVSDQAMAREFPGYFPHGLHQGVLARNPKPAARLRDEWSFVRTSFSRSNATPTQEPDNCTTCHVTDKRPSVAIAVGGNEKTLKPADGTFKTEPSGHASCFNCHWQTQKPTKDRCEGCHLSPDEVSKKRKAASVETPLPGLVSPNAAQWFKDWPRDWPKRLSLKFSHESTNHNNFGCTTCHINITQMETLNIPKADVPITTCAQCHLKADPSIKTSLRREMAARKKDGKYVCTSCHTSVIGREPPKCSHYLVIGEACKQ